MTVYEANRKNVFRARARARPGQRQQQHFCGDLSLFVVIYKPWSRSEDTFYSGTFKIINFVKHIHIAHTSIFSLDVPFVPLKSTSKAITVILLLHKGQGVL